MSRIVIIGGGPAGYEAALVAAQFDADVTLIEDTGAGGACVISDCVPSKTFIASSTARTAMLRAEGLGVLAGEITVDAAAVHDRVKLLALQQSADICAKLVKVGVDYVTGRAKLAGRGSDFNHRVQIVPSGGSPYEVEADVVLLATGASPRILRDARPDGQRVLTWRQVYDLETLPERLIVIGSGVTGAEFASAYLAMGVDVTLVSSRDHVLPHEDIDAAQAIESVFVDRGMTIIPNARAMSVAAEGDGVKVKLADGTDLSGTHALMTVGSVPNTAGLGLSEVGIELKSGGFIATDRVSRTNIPGVYAAGDVTGVHMLASVAAMQGRIAMWHALGEAVKPLQLQTVAANVFTDPELATVGATQADVDSGRVPARTIRLPLEGNARAKMSGHLDGFVKLFCRPASGLVVGGVVVAPDASELILPISLAIENHLTVAQLAQTITIYPSFSGSLAEAARQLMQHEFE
ncbi:dihydrolipoamide dehydrogenase [Stackebrandtia endophytica]|uniref:Dihydrolipoamide dehydrogenase n=1 Tax=Stackebrandtia endophytica TaxID=1496996 RepID=A0A543ATC3_9ACTN|nr:NAD(P)H-quinone dehydrogenase [Stackebrandtia endophytica]TQL75837.1 dihydrolipoamide dehydrogenase [Stackebrandtia endophytica]